MQVTRERFSIERTDVTVSGRYHLALISLSLSLSLSLYGLDFATDSCAKATSFEVGSRSEAAPIYTHTLAGLYKIAPSSIVVALFFFLLSTSSLPSDFVLWQLLRGFQKFVLKVVSRRFFFFFFVFLFFSVIFSTFH
jgi:hypothetical protein